MPAEIRRNLLNVADCLACVGNGAREAQFECRIYDGTPPFALFQCAGEATMIFYEYHKDLKDTQSLTFSMGTPLGHYVTGVFEDVWKNAETCMPIEDYLALRGWFGRYLDGVRYLRGRECAGESACRPDLWLLLTGEQYSQVQSYVAGGEPVDIDDVLPGSYVVEQHPVDLVRRLAVQKYGEAAAGGLGVALAATRRKAAASAASV